MKNNTNFLCIYRNNDKLIVAEGSFGISIWDISES